MRIPYCIRIWFSWSGWRYFVVHRIGGYVQRGRRGWASHDTWSFDTYLSEVIAGGLRELAEYGHGYPCDFPGEFEGWQAWLREKADWFEWYAKDEDGTSDELGWIRKDLTREERRARMDAYQAKMDKFFNEVLPDFCKYFGNLWD